jgi:hypothetical protein
MHTLSVPHWVRLRFCVDPNVRYRLSHHVALLAQPKLRVSLLTCCQPSLLQHLFAGSEAEVAQCVRAVFETVSVPVQAQQAIHEKYAHARFLAVSRVPVRLLLRVCVDARVPVCVSVCVLVCVCMCVCVNFDFGW